MAWDRASARSRRPGRPARNRIRPGPQAPRPALMADDQRGLSAGRCAVGAFRDLAVGPGDTDGDAAHQQCPVLPVGLGNLLGRQRCPSRPVQPSLRARRHPYPRPLRRAHPIRGIPACTCLGRSAMTASPPERFDVVVVGAGPAGMIAALRAGRLGGARSRAWVADRGNRWADMISACR
jgi:hypothetical protein